MGPGGLCGAGWEGASRVNRLFLRAQGFPREQTISSYTIALFRLPGTGLSTIFPQLSSTRSHSRVFLVWATVTIEPLPPIASGHDSVLHLPFDVC